MQSPGVQIHRFSFGSLLAVLILVGTLILFDESWVSWFILTVVIALLCGDILVSRLPLKFRRELNTNCIRLDGTLSKRRERLEKDSLAKLRRDVGIVLMLVIVPNSMLAWVIDREVIPVATGFGWLIGGGNRSAPSEIDLASMEREFDQWQEANSNPISNHEHRQLLRTQWPLLLIAIFMWLAVCFYFLRQMYIQQLNQFEAAIRSRRRIYHLKDQARLFEPGKF